MKKQNESPEKKKSQTGGGEKNAPGYRSSIPDLPFPTDPPVPNRAWTEMRLGKDIDELSEEEKAAILRAVKT